MESFRCYDNSDVIATLMLTNFHLNTTVVTIFPNVCLWWRSLCSDLVLTLKNCIEPPSNARTAYVVAIWPSFLFYSFVKIWETCEIFWANGLPPPLAKNFTYAYEHLYKHVVPIFFRLSWHFKRKNPFLESIFIAKQELITRTLSFVYKTSRLVRISLLISNLNKEFFFSRESFLIKAIENFFPVFA